MNDTMTMTAVCEYVEKADGELIGLCEEPATHVIESSSFASCTSNPGPDWVPWSGGSILHVCQEHHDQWVEDHC